MTTEDERAKRRPNTLLLGGAVLTAAAVALFLVVDPILGTFVGILGITLLGIGALSRIWDQHPSFEQRELARSRKRQAKWERNAGARARDRARWEAHQARQARQAEQSE